MNDYADVALKVLAAAGLAFVGWTIYRRRYDFVIRVDSSGTRISGRIARAQHGNIATFFRDRVPPPSRGAILVRGRRLRSGRVVLEIRGPIDEGTKQQIRNFLATT